VARMAAVSALAATLAPRGTRRRAASATVVPMPAVRRHQQRVPGVGGGPDRPQPLGGEVGAGAEHVAHLRLPTSSA